ncbi:MAG: peptide chain release factor N(5)-glutamine methyltransferase [Acidobacteria bacterium]|nr:peptide chain release factor N(5)-glutamine methyltransferase [Acidobacteriota bacterium]
MTDVNSDLVVELVELGLERREARWLVEEFVPGGDLDAIVALRLAATRRLEGEPLQYIIGHWPFRSLDLDVDERVLIPRPETEELVEVAMRELARLDVSAPLILDLGCGSGAIGLSLLDELRSRGIAASLVAVDESRDALAVARRNALKHHLHSVSFVQSSWFEDIDVELLGRFELIVSNPPYVGERELKDLDPVLGYEPHGALVAPDASGVAGFDDLATIIAHAPRWLKPGGVLVCEHGDRQRAAVLDASVAAGFDAHDIDDMAGHPRILVARR